MLHAGNSSQISDGAAAVLVCGADTARELGLTPIARVHTAVLAADDPNIMLTAPIPATQKALQRAGLRVDEIGAFEVSEAFASVPLAWLHETGADEARMNVSRWSDRARAPARRVGRAPGDDAVAPHARQRHRYGLQTMCEGGGQSNATIFELV